MSAPKQDVTTMITCSKNTFNEPKTILSKLTIFPVNSRKLFSYKYFLTIDYCLWRSWHEMEVYRQVNMHYHLCNRIIHISHCLPSVTMITKKCTKNFYWTVVTMWLLVLKQHLSLELITHRHKDITIFTSGNVSVRNPFLWNAPVQRH